jgi:hypothetical protein
VIVPRQQIQHPPPRRMADRPEHIGLAMERRDHGDIMRK